MKKFITFEEFAAEKAKKTQVQLEQELSTKRDAAANSFKEILSEFGVASIGELSEEDRLKFNEKLGTLTESVVTEGNDFEGPGLIVVGKTRKDNDLIDQATEESGFYGIYNTRDDYWFFPEEGDQATIDKLENELETIFIKKGANVRYEAQYESVVAERVSKIACLDCDEVNTEKAWKKNKGFCPSCKTSTQGVAESVDEGKKYDTLDDFEKDAKIGTIFYLGSEDQFKRSSKKDYYKIIGKKTDGSLIVNRGTSNKKYTIGADRYDEPVIIVKESVVNEAKIKSDAEFKEYAFTVLQEAFGEDFDAAKAQEVVDGILGKVDGDYGKAAGILQSSLS